ncbi:MAG TPA: hypothetical protein DCY00_06250 [Actinobacteria bacterium]|nr:hypothetical protein [Actinomycetota bacterium]
MKLQAKITIIIIPLILLGTVFLGFWSLREAEKSIYDSNILYMNTFLDSYISDLEKLNNLLVINRLEKIDSFLTEYKANALEIAADIKKPEKSNIYIINSSDELIFSSGNDNEYIRAALLPITENIELYEGNLVKEKNMNFIFTVLLLPLQAANT